ncbi:MAG: hypothetical protein ACSNEK_08105 [Parachlamydiaceae bacterium]
MSPLTNSSWLARLEDRAVDKQASSTFMVRQFSSRCYHLTLIPIALVANALDVIVGLMTGVASILSAGANKKFNRLVAVYLPKSSWLFSHPFEHLLSSINPSARFSNDKVLIKEEGFGFLSGFTISYFDNKANEFYHSNHFVKKHLVSRLFFSLTGLMAMITRVADGILSVPVACAALVAFGKLTSLNNLAYRTLQAPGCMFDLCYCALGVINPGVDFLVE